MECYLGEIRMFSGNYAPEDDGWTLCDGKLLKIAEYNALFALIGTTYGGDGVNNFAVPDLRGRLPVGQGQGTTETGTPLTARTLGQKNGAETVMLTSAQMPAHTHPVAATANSATSNNPTGNLWANTNTNTTLNGYTTKPTNGAMYATAINAIGQNQPHSNIMPSLAISFIICLNGLWPSQN